MSPLVKKNPGKPPEFALGVFASSDRVLGEVVPALLNEHFRKGQRTLSYFRFPNANTPENLVPPGTRAVFRVFVSGRNILNALRPPREFKQLDGLVFFIDSSSQKSLFSFIPYLKKVLEAKRRFIPITIFEVPAAEGDPDLQFEHFLKVKFLLDVIGGRVNLVGRFVVGKNEGIFGRKLRVFVELSKLDSTAEKRQLPLLTIEELVRELERSILEILSEPLATADLIDLLVNLENQLKRPITRGVLCRWYGQENEFAKQVLDEWEALGDPSRREQILESVAESPVLHDEAAKYLKRCRNLGLEPNFASLKLLGLRFDEITKVVANIDDRGEIGHPPSFHVQNKSFVDFTNIEEFVVVKGGQTLFIRQTKGTTLERTTLFAGMIQAIEVLREEFLKKVKESYERETIELLDFGPLKALIATDNAAELKVIVRLREKPRRKTYKRLELFLKKTVELLEDDKDPNIYYHDTSDRISSIFDEYFNPLPLKVNFFEEFVAAPRRDPEHFTRREQVLLEAIEADQPVSLKEVLDKAGVLNFARGDLVSTLLELIKEGALLRAPT
ncbi:MAG: hypothetical protein ACTSU5_22535 [Promethearchaeota archaeon]